MQVLRTEAADRQPAAGPYAFEYPSDPDYERHLCYTCNTITQSAVHSSGKFISSPTTRWKTGPDRELCSRAAPHCRVLLLFLPPQSINPVDETLASQRRVQVAQCAASPPRCGPPLYRMLAVAAVTQTYLDVTSNCIGQARSALQKLASRGKTPLPYPCRQPESPGSSQCQLPVMGPHL